MNTLKYAVLVLPSRSANDTREVQVGSNVETLVAGLADLVDRTELEHWERWVGEGRWGDLSSRTRVVVATAPTSRPEVFDPENEELKASLNPFVTPGERAFFSAARHANVGSSLMPGLSPSSPRGYALFTKGGASTRGRSIGHKTPGWTLGSRRPR